MAMIAVISPAKTLDCETPPPFDMSTKPEFLSDANDLAGRLKKFSAKRLSGLMHISPKLGELNYTRYRDWGPTHPDARARPAIFAFKGDVYAGLDAASLSRRDLEFAQKHLRMLSGLYGVLRPFDLMQAYRLEMGTALKTDKGDNLYKYWGGRITASLNESLANGDGKRKGREPVLVNLASQEYFGAVRPEALKARVITPMFKEWRNGKLKFISFNAKKARGMMSRYMICERLQDPEGLKGFDVAGYRFDAGGTDGDEWLFVREQ